MAWPDDVLNGPLLVDIFDQAPIVDEGAIWSWADAIAATIIELARELARAPTMSREAGRHWCKLHGLECGVFYKSVIWPQARLAIGLPRCGRGGCPKGARHVNRRRRNPAVRFSEAASRIEASRR
jgi:hypothetical protein